MGESEENKKSEAKHSFIDVRKDTSWIAETAQAKPVPNEQPPTPPNPVRVSKPENKS